MIFTRSILEKAFPGNPRAVAAFERLDELLSTTNEEGQTLAEQLAAVIAAIGDGGSFQPASSILTLLAQTDDGSIGVFEKIDSNNVILHEVDSANDACLVPRNKLVGYVGSGATGSRPSLSSQRRAIYWDTTLGMPIFWTGSSWRDFTGAAV